MCSVFDNEEVGSGTKQGAGSTFGADVLKYNVAQKYTAAPEKAAYIYAGQIRDELGSRLDLLEKNAYRFCYINDFPMSGTAQDLMYGAPSEITEQQLREVHIKVRD
jgi:aspartyl-tRNA synthetase